LATLKLKRIALGACVLLAFAGRALAQTEVNGSAGAVFGWPQDVTVEIRDAHDRTNSVFHENSLPVRRGGIWQIGLTRWSEAHPLAGMELELLGWQNAIRVSTSSGVAPQGFREQHTAFLAYLSGRTALGKSHQSYLYGGIGGGLVESRIKRSKATLGPALSLLGGISSRIGSHGWSASVEGRYLLTRDFDALVRDHGNVTNVEFSGHASLAAARPILGPHMDSRFAGVLLGLRWTAVPRRALRR
jgi:hypothetical protein